VKDQPPAFAGVSLRLLTPTDADALDGEQTPELNAFSWFGVRRSGLRRRVETGEDITDVTGSFAVSDAAGRLLGDVSWRKLPSGPTPASFYYNIGIYLLGAERGKGYGTEAQRLLADYLFATTLAHRVEASTDVTNVAEQRALEKAGFTREGVLRGIQYRFGAWHDMVSYSKLRGES
jgi:RimJ/RimL family protein N-acetyltransferase